LLPRNCGTASGSGKQPDPGKSGEMDREGKGSERRRSHARFKMSSGLGLSETLQAMGRRTPLMLNWLTSQVWMEDPVGCISAPCSTAFIEVNERERRLPPLPL
jgi:hypothetical protein